MPESHREADRDKERTDQGRRADETTREEGPATFSRDIRGGGPGAGADLGRGGTSTPTGDIAGGGQPGSLVDIGEGTVTSRDAIPTGGAGDLARHERAGEPRQERLPEPPVETQRTALDGAPGIPAGSGTGLDKALQTPDSELGGAVAGDTTPSGPTGDEPDERRVREDDRKRNTL